MGEILQVAKEVMVPVILLALLYAVLYCLVLASKYAASKLEQMRSEAEASGRTAQAAAFNMALTVLDGVTNTVVSVMESEKAYTLRQKVKAGEADYEDLKALSQEAYAQIVQLLDVQVKESLSSCLTDTEAYIKDKIEEMLPQIKASYRDTVAQEIWEDVPGNEV